MNFLQKLDAAVEKNNSLVCVGLDPDVSKIPEKYLAQKDGIFEFLKSIVDATAEFVCAYKPNSAFFEENGSEGIKTLEQICDYINSNYPEIPIIYDCKRGDIGNTNKAYAVSAFDKLKVDAVTLHPYFGKESLLPFLEYKDKGQIILIKSSNEGSGEIQNLDIGDKKLFEYISEKVVNEWNENNNCLLMIGATYPNEMASARQIAGDEIPFLVPGVGAQSGDIGAMLNAGLNSNKKGLIVSSTRAILYASDGDDFADAAKNETIKLKDTINSYRA